MKDEGLAKAAESHHQAKTESTKQKAETRFFAVFA
jgi:hypothetical protein